MTYPPDWYSNDEASAAGYEASYNETTRLQEALDNGYEPEPDR